VVTSGDGRQAGLQAGGLATPGAWAVADNCPVFLVPDVDYRRMLAELSADQRRDPAGAGTWLDGAWSGACCSQVPDSLLREFDEVATFLFDQAGTMGAPQADRTIAARGFSRPGRRARDVACQRGLPFACRAG